MSVPRKPRRRKKDVNVPGFQWLGRKNGVSRWAGNIRSPWLGRIFVIYGLLAGTMGIGVGLYLMMSGQYHSGRSVLPLIGLIHGLAFGLPGAWLLKMRRSILSYNTLEQAAAKFNVTPETLRQVAEARDIPPRLIFNEDELYDVSDFAEAATLLRASSEASITTSPDLLLRPAAGSGETYPDELLRSAVPTLDETTLRSIGLTTKPIEPETQQIRVSGSHQ